MNTKKVKERLIEKEILRRLNEASEQLVKPSELAKSLNLKYAGWGRWMNAEGQIVAKTVDGQLIKLAMPEEVEKPTIDPKVEKQLDQIYKNAARWEYKPRGDTHISPGWNKDRKMSDDDIPYDANGEKTVQKLLAKVGDPKKLVDWLIRKFKEETPNGKQRILQYLGILKKMGIGKDSEPTTQPANEPVTSSQPEPKSGLKRVMAKKKAA